jgi:Holliday junction resolvase
MPNSNYVAGRAFEYQIVKLFKENGYEATRTAGSHGTWDIIALKRTPTKEYEVRLLVLAQCKTRQREDL